MIHQSRAIALLFAGAALLAVFWVYARAAVSDGVAQAPMTLTTATRLPTPAIMLEALDSATRDVVQAAMLEMDQLEASALADQDGSQLPRRATGTYLSGLLKQIDYYHQRGMRKQSELISADFTAFRGTGPGQVEVDGVEVWDRRFFDRDGQLVSEALRQRLPQTAVFVQEDGQWKITDLNFHLSPAE